MRHIDPELGQPLPEKSYGGSCLIYDKERPDDPYHNFWVLMHLMFFAFFMPLITLSGQTGRQRRSVVNLSVHRMNQF